LHFNLLLVKSYLSGNNLNTTLGYPQMDIVSSKILAKNIKKQRGKLSLSQDQLARKADIPYSTYLKIESGYTPNPSIQTIANIAEALGVTVDLLIGRKT